MNTYDAISQQEVAKEKELSTSYGMTNRYFVSLIADPTPNRFRIPPPRVSSIGYPNPPTSNTTIDVNYSGFTPQAQAAFQYAVDIWESLINSPVNIEIDASFTSLGDGILGSAGPNDIYRDFSGAPRSGTWYAVALANSRAGTDLNGGTAEITARFNSDFSNWYYGTDGRTPLSQYDFVTTVLHELAHGLGFLGLWEYSGGSGRWGLGSGFPSTYDRFVENGAGQSLIDTSIFPNPSTTLGSQITSNNIYFDGANANSANGGNRVPLYAPSTWSTGSSMSHLAESFNNTVNALMTYSGSPGEAIHNPGPVALGLLKDTGWNLATTITPTITVTLNPTSVTEDGTTNLVYTFSRSGSNSTALNNVNFRVSGSAIFNNDYTQTGAASFTTTSGTVNFGVGSSRVTVIVDPRADTTVEPNETAIFTVTNGTGYTVGNPNTATGTITNDDGSTNLPTVNLTVTPRIVPEAGTGVLLYTFSRNGSLTNPLTVNFTLGGTATLNTDYNQLGASITGSNGQINFAPGQDTAVVVVDPRPDTIAEVTETVLLTLATSPNYNRGITTPVTGSITNVGGPITTTLTNSNPIGIPAGTGSSGPASLYPSTINASGITGTITKVTATLRGLSHTWPDDLDILLTGPTGQKVLLMSDAGGGTGVNNVNLTFDSTVAASLPDTTLINSGTYRPTNFGTGDTFNSPAPIGPYSGTLGVFNSTNPNGAWNLYVMDDSFLDTGAIAQGWQLSIQTV